MVDSTSTSCGNHHPVLARMMRLLKAKKIRRQSSRAVGENNTGAENSLELEYESMTSFASTHNKVFGRHKELQQLLAIYEHMTASGNSSSLPNSRLALVHGKSGVGKSALVRAFVKLLPKQAIFVAGKFDQLKIHAPYAALIKAANDLSREALRRRDSEYFLGRIRDELGPDLDLLGNILDALSSLAKKKTAIATTGQALTRFKLLMRSFLRSVATLETPVVLFLDDLQWADLATMEVLHSLLTDKQSAYVFFIFSHRQEEMDQQILNDYVLPKTSGRHHAETSKICVNNLDLTSLNEMVATVLNLNSDLTSSLSTMILQKTQGNPFYALNFMDKLHADGMLRRTPDNNNGWTWDGTTILQQTNVADNLADILEAKILRLPERVRSILQLASFIGHDFSARILLIIVYEEQDMIESDYSFDLLDREVIQDWILKALNLALKEGLLEESAGEGTFKFSHDKIQQCLYKDLIPDDVERRLLHQRIGKLIWNTIRMQEASSVEDWILFLAADNLNRGPKFLDDDDDRREIVELNVRAGKLAASKAAFLVGVEYLRSGEKLITDDSFVKNNHDLCMDLWRVAADFEGIVGEFGRANELGKIIHKYAREPQHHFPAYLIEIKGLAIQGEVGAAMKLAFKVLKQMGVKFPKRITPLTVIVEYIQTRLAIGKKTPQDLMTLPILNGGKMLFVFELLSVISRYAFAAGEAAFVAVNLRMARLTFQHGLSEYAPYAFVSYGTVCCFFGDFQLGLSFGDASQRLLERFDAQSSGAGTQFNYLIFISPWIKGYAGLSESFLRVYHQGMLEGEVDFAGACWLGWIMLTLTGTISLDECVKKSTRVRLEMEEYGQKTLLLVMIPALQVARNKFGDDSNSNPAILTGQDMNLEEFRITVEETKSNTALSTLLYCEMDVAMYFGDWERVRVKMPKLEKVATATEGLFSYPANLSMLIWCCFQLYSMTGKKRHQRVGHRHYRQLKQYAKQSPLAMAYCKVAAAAEAAFVKKRPLEKCEELFVSVMRDLEEAKSRRIKSFVADTLAELFLKANNNEKGVQYLQESLECNARWGAKEKVKYLERKISDVHAMLSDERINWG